MPTRANHTTRKRGRSKNARETETESGKTNLELAEQLGRVAKRQLILLVRGKAELLGIGERGLERAELAHVDCGAERLDGRRLGLKRRLAVGPPGAARPPVPSHERWLSGRAAACQKLFSKGTCS